MNSTESIVSAVLFVAGLILLSIFLSSCGGIERSPCYLLGEDCNEGNQTQVVHTHTEHRGEKGETGESIVGPDGIDGTSCSVVETETGAVIFCEDGTSAEVLHGERGPKGNCGGKKK